MAMHPNAVGAGQVLQGLDQNAGIVFNSAFEIFNGNFPSGCFCGGAADGNMVVATGQEDQFDIRGIVGLGEITVIFQKAVNANDCVSSVGAMVTDGNCTLDRKSTRLNSSHVRISYAVFCLKKKKNKN